MTGRLRTHSQAVWVSADMRKANMAMYRPITSPQAMPARRMALTTISE